MISVVRLGLAAASAENSSSQTNPGDGLDGSSVNSAQVLSYPRLCQNRVLAPRFHEASRQVDMDEQPASTQDNSFADILSQFENRTEMNQAAENQFKAR